MTFLLWVFLLIHFEFLAFNVVVLKTSFLISVYARGQVPKAAQDAVHEKDGSHTNKELAHQTF